MMEIERVEFIHEADQATSYNEVSRILGDHGFTVLDYDTTNETFTVKYNKCESNLTFTFRDYVARVANKVYCSLSFLNLYNGGIILNTGNVGYQSFAYIAPESDEDEWVLIKTGYNDEILKTWMKDDEDEGWHDMYDDTQPFPSLNGIQLVNYYNFKKQRLYGNIYICKKLPNYRLFYRHYYQGNGSTIPEEVFTDVPEYVLMYQQHWNSTPRTDNAERLFNERIKIDNKIFIIYNIPMWDYGNNSYYNPAPDSQTPKGFRNVPFAIRVS